MSKNPCATQMSLRMIRVTIWLLISSLTGCHSKVTPPPKPPLVPANAVWAGGPDGGSFIECDVDAEHNVNRCLAYNESTGDVTGGGFFQLSGSARAARSDELRFNAFDGTGSILKKACSSQRSTSVRLRFLRIQSSLAACLFPAVMQDHLKLIVRFTGLMVACTSMVNLFSLANPIRR